MSNKQARASNKIRVTNLLAITSDGAFITFDINKVSLIDANTGSTILAPQKREAQ